MILSLITIFFLSNFFVFIHILKFGFFLVSQKFLGLLASTTHFSTSTTHLPAALQYRGSYVGNKDDAKLPTTWKYGQFFATPKKQVKSGKKRKLQCYTYQPTLSNLLPLYFSCILVNYELFCLGSNLFDISLLYKLLF